MKKTLFFGLLLLSFVEYGVMSQNQTDQNPAQSEQNPAQAQQNQLNMEQILKDALTVRIQAKLFQQVEDVVWQSSVEKLTIPGRAVTINMQNEQAKLSMHFTPYRKNQGGLILVAQSEIWLRVPAEGDQKENLRYFTSMRSIPLDYDEIIYFYPLGKLEDMDNPEQIHIEMALNIRPYTEVGTAAADSSDGQK